jgi:hypothetical protein
MGTCSFVHKTCLTSITRSASQFLTALFMSTPTQFIVAFLVLAAVVPATPAFAQTNDERQLGQKFLYCGHLTMRLLRLQEQAESKPGKYRDQEDRTYMRMLMTSGAYIPSAQLTAEYKSASERLSADVQAAATLDPSGSAATAKFLQRAYSECQAHEKAYGQAAFLQGAARARSEAAAESASSPGGVKP